MISRKRLPVAKNCYFCHQGKEPDYKEIEILEKFLSERGKILGRSRTGVCNKHQKRFSRAVKRARFLALLPFIPPLK